MPHLVAPAAALPADVTVDARDRLLAYDDLTFTYTDAGELLTKTQSGQTVEYDYDVFGNLKSVELPGGTEIEYVTDGANRRIGKKIDGTLVQGFLYQDALNPIAELDGAGNVVSRFVYATRSNVPDYMIQGGVTYRIVTDHLGSVRLVVDVATGTIAQELRYDEFGRVTLDTSPGFQPFGFAGGLYDSQTGLVRFGARDYDPALGRWTVEDVRLFSGASTNNYIYTTADPVNFYDPGGFTQRDIDLAVELVRETQDDLKVPKKFKPNLPKDGPMGKYNFLTGRVRLNAQYLEELTDVEAADLLDTVIHECLHKTFPFKDHEKIYDEAADRAGEIVEEYQRRRNQPEEPESQSDG